MNPGIGLLLCLLALASAPAAAGNLFTVYSNLGTGTNAYNCCTGWTVSGTGTIGQSFTAANEFVPTFSDLVSEIDVAVGYVTGVNSFYINIDADNDGQPGAVIASFNGLFQQHKFRELLRSGQHFQYQWGLQPERRHCLLDGDRAHLNFGHHLGSVEPELHRRNGT